MSHRTALRTSWDRILAYKRHGYILSNRVYSWDVVLVARGEEVSTQIVVYNSNPNERDFHSVKK